MQEHWGLWHPRLLERDTPWDGGASGSTALDLGFVMDCDVRAKLHVRST